MTEKHYPTNANTEIKLSVVLEKDKTRSPCPPEHSEFAGYLYLLRGEDVSCYVFYLLTDVAGQL